MQSTTSKPRLSFWQLWNMSFGFFGIQFGFALQNTNTSRIFSTLGATPDELPLFWLAAPATGLLVQPIIGYLSDNTWHPKWGRRRPFFFIGALLASISLFLMPNSTAVWMAILVLWLMDASINVSMEPFRAFVGDKLDESQQTAGFAMQTFFIGLGGVIASLLPIIFTDVLHVSNEVVNGAIPDSVRYSFYAGGAAYFFAVLWTVLTADELPPEDVEKFRMERAQRRGFANSLKEVLGGFVHMPKTMVQLALVQFFTWFALLAMWVFTTPAIAESVFNTTDGKSAAFQEAGNWTGILFATYGGVSALAVFFLPKLAKFTSRKFVHMVCLLIGGAGLASIAVAHSKEMLIVSMIGVGIAWASILTMPYAILAGSLPARRMGYFMGVFNYFIVLPQIVANLVLGPVIKHLFDGHAVNVLVLAGIAMALGGISTLLVSDTAKPAA
ncbi:MFS transporter [Pseudoduganella sp. OTU4001]|uniref:MFS transporter n=1 Tax=Pseudoduganella sp. OTU4001 TaxID=3043854 RepID=UPI00313DFCD4